MESKKACSFTGHRQIKHEEIPQVITRLNEVIAEQIVKGIDRFLVGGAIGFDSLAAQAVLSAREEHRNIKLVVVQPCKNQDAKWREVEKVEYRRILAAADEVICLSDHYYNGCMQERNLYLVRYSSVCVAYMKHGRSGTAQTVRFAREQGVTVINLAEQ